MKLIYRFSCWLDEWAHDMLDRHSTLTRRGAAIAMIHKFSHELAYFASPRLDVTSSCGCVFCDIGLSPYLAQWESNDVARYWHDADTERVECTNPKTFKGVEARCIVKRN